MTSLRVPLALLTAALFIIPPAATGLNEGAGGPGDGPRAVWHQPAAFEADLKQNGSVYATSFNLPVWANATVSAAGFEVLGKYVMGNSTSNTTDYSNWAASGHKAYKGQVLKFDPMRTTLKSLMMGQFSSGEYDYVAYSDDTYVSQAGDFSDDIDGYELFCFNFSIDLSTQVTIVWEGCAGTTYSKGRALSVFVWNAASEIWESLGTGSPTSDATVNQVRDGDWYITNRNVYVLARCDDGYSIFTDYVRVTANGYPYFFPKNPKMDIGANGVIDWTLLEEKLNYTTSCEDPAIAEVLTELARGSTTQFANITVRISSETPGKIKVGNFNYTFTAPPYCSAIPDTYKLDEDSAATRLIDLNKYFFDDSSTPLIFSKSVYVQDPKKLNVSLDSDGHSLNFKTLAKNWWGKLRVSVSATDTDAYTTRSNNFTVTINPIDDAPVIQPIGDQVARQYEPFSVQVKATDVDTTLDRNETINFSDDTAIFDIDPSGGWMNFTPKQSDVGAYNITITATDRAGVNTTQSFTLTVEDVEDPPVMKSIPDQLATEEEPFTFTAFATDTDLPYGDSLVFSDDTDLFDIDPVTGVISFTPRTKDIGVYKITLRVNDTHGKSDRRTMNLTVRNYLGTVDKPPSIPAIPDQTAVEAEPFTLTINATDPELEDGDSISYSDSSPLFVIDPMSGVISFTPNSLNVGSHKVTITAEDQDGLTASASFKLIILRKNAPPNITLVKPKPGTKALVDRDVFLSADATDPDGDALTYIWREGAYTLGTGSGILATFNTTGIHNVTLVVSDGRTQAIYNFTLNIVKSLPSNPAPGFGVAAMLAAVLAAVACLAARKRRFYVALRGRQDDLARGR